MIVWLTFPAVPCLLLESWGGQVAGRPHLSVDRGQGDGVVIVPTYVVYTGGRKRNEEKTMRRVTTTGVSDG